MTHDLAGTPESTQRRRVEMPLIYRYLGDRRFTYALPRALALQILLPGNAAGLVQHVHSGLWAHKQRAVSEMVYIAYSNRDLTSVLRTAHAHVKGVDGQGHRYHSLNPEMFFFQHATYVDAMFTAIDHFMRPISDDEKDQLYTECCRWYEKYDISVRAMPRSRREFAEYLDDFCSTRLEMTSEAESLRHETLHPNTWYPAKVPPAAIRAMLHPRSAELLGVEVSAADRAALKSFGASVRMRAALTPRSLRLIPSARHNPDD